MPTGLAPRVDSCCGGRRRIRPYCIESAPALGYQVDTYESAEDFLQSGRLSTTACLVLDIRMPGINGVELQDRLNGVAAGTPIVFMTAHADANVRQRALKAGAVDFLHKPFSDDALLAAIRHALAARG
jgi:FixJ family two-component response regulator